MIRWTRRTAATAFGRAGSRCAALAVSLGLLPLPAASQEGSYVNFETVPTRALALSPDGTRLFVANTPDGRLEVFERSSDGLRALGSVTVGLDPVALAARSNDEVWVVNLLSDSVSIVDVSGATPRVTRTLLVGDEPRDIVFAGPDRSRAFISAARRGQNHPEDILGELQTPGVGRADVWVFDANQLGNSLGGEPLTIVQLFADKPGAMAVSADGRDVFVAISTSGNLTSAIASGAICTSDGMAGKDFTLGVGAGILSREDDGPCTFEIGGTGPGGVPRPNENQVDATPIPLQPVIVEFQPETGAWLDVVGRDWRDAVAFSLPDNDVFVLDAMADPPRERTAIQTVGTLNKGIAIDPTTGKAFVANIEAINTNRFLSVPRLGLFPNPNPAEGVAKTADPATGKTLNGHLYESRISILEADGRVKARHLNKHIDYEVVPSPPGVKERSVADPQGLAFSPDGETLFVAALGSNKIVPFKRSELEDDSFEPDASTHIQLSGDGGPTDMVLSPDGTRMFVYKRFDNAVATIDLETGSEIAVDPLFSSEPDEVKLGRKFLYDATLTSSNGEANCNVCHPAGDKDDLAWDLGSPFAGVSPNPNELVNPGGAIDPEQLANLDPAFLENLGITPELIEAILARGSITTYNPLKGPMTVLTLRGISDGGPMFWRGEASNEVDPLDARANFQNFNMVFEALLGREAPLPQADFDRFTDFVLSITPPPNPHRPLDNQLNASQAAGRDIFLEGVPGPGPTCDSCHTLDPAQGFFGTRGSVVVESAQIFKPAGLRLAYDKIGGAGRNSGMLGRGNLVGGFRKDVGPQVRGFGLSHDGTNSSVEELLDIDGFFLNPDQIVQVADFVFAFRTNMAPIVGQQATLRSDSGQDIVARIDLFEQRAATAFTMRDDVTTRECELVAKVVVDGRERGFLFDPSARSFRDDAGGSIASADLRALASEPGQEVTFTCMYPGGGRRFGIDRDLDGQLDGMGLVEGPAPDPDPPVAEPPIPEPAQPLNLLQRLLRLLFGGRDGLGSQDGLLGSLGELFQRLLG